MKLVKRILLTLLVVFVLIQFVRPEENRHPGAQPASVLNRYPASPHVTAILEKACNDCHSNNTKYPWYNRVQPVAWWLGEHIKDGKRGLNFDSFLVYTPKRQARKMEETIGMVKKGAMPLDSYTWIHKDAILTPSEKAALAGWADSVRKAVLSAGAL
jgi:hypothetical protein